MRGFRCDGAGVSVDGWGWGARVEVSGLRCEGVGVRVEVRGSRCEGSRVEGDDNLYS